MRILFVLLLIFLITMSSVFAQNQSDGFTDSCDGNVNKAVKIGYQWGMAENLACLPQVSPPAFGSHTEKFYRVHGYFGTDVAEAKATANYSAHSVLYNWPAAMNGSTSSDANPSRVQGACPFGWHLPGDTEWTILSDFPGGGNVVGGKMKDTGATDESGFSALPGGYHNNDGSFDLMGGYGRWWSSTQNSPTLAFTRSLSYDLMSGGLYSNYKEHGFSVRIISDHALLSDNMTFNLNLGWNIVSFNIMTENPDIKAVFQSLINDGSLVKVQDEIGNSLEDYGIFGGWTNNIGAMALTEGYKVKVNKNCQLNIIGNSASFPIVIPLKAGWNIMGYPGNTVSDGMAVVQQLIDRKTLVKVQDETGNAIEDYGIFGGWTNNIGNFKPGEGYKIKVKTDEVLTLYFTSPSLTTSSPDSITNNSVILGGFVTNDGGSPVTERGVCYSTTQTPTTESTKISIGSGTGFFRAKVTGLADTTTYYARAYAINSQGTTYGLQVSFKTILSEEPQIDNFFKVGTEKHALNSGFNVWFSELDCGNLDIYAHGLYLTSDISIDRYDYSDGGMSLLPTGKGDLIIFNLFNKNTDLIPGKYTFVDEVDCNGLVKDGDTTFVMSGTDKFVTAEKVMNDPTCFALNVDLEINWAEVDLNNPPVDVVNKYMNYVNSIIGIKEGYVIIEKDNDLYLITINCIDKNGAVITGKYTGKLDFVSFGI